VGVIGFDLDMTLVDSSAAIMDGVAAVARAFDVVIDEVRMRRSIGLPLDVVFAELAPDVPYDEALAIYRARYLSHGLVMHHVLPGARESLETVVADGYAVLVVSAKKDTHVRAVLREVDLDHLVADVVGERFGDGKSEALLAVGAEVYVGDHPGDVVGARGAGAVAIAVATGPTPADELAAAGADLVLDDLTEFLPWWRDRTGREADAAEETA
jgi:phosphoglycolate phosphatase